MRHVGHKLVKGHLDFIGGRGFLLSNWCVRARLPDRYSPVALLEPDYFRTRVMFSMLCILPPINAYNCLYVTFTNFGVQVGITYLDSYLWPKDHSTMKVTRSFTKVILRAIRF